jgi:heme-degrading monooxygenase HmoA
VITRMWRGWTRSDQADRYEQHYRTEVLDTLRQVPGFRGARLLRRTIGEETEFVSLTFFDDLDAIRSFAGSGYETAVVAGEARKVLLRLMSASATTRPRSTPEGAGGPARMGSGQLRSRFIGTLPCPRRVAPAGGYLVGAQFARTVGSHSSGCSGPSAH